MAEPTEEQQKEQDQQAQVDSIKVEFDGEKKFTMSEEDVCSTIVGFWEDWKQQRRKKELTWEDCINAYLTEIDETKYENFPWRSKVADTFIQETGDSISAALRSALFPLNEEYYEVEGLDEMGVKHAAAMKKEMDLQLYSGKFLERVKPFLKQISIIGNAPAMLPWVTKTRRTKRRLLVPDGKGTKTETQYYNKPIFDGMVFDTLDATDVVVDGRKSSFEQTPFIRRTYKTLAELKLKKGVYKNLDKIEDSTSSTSSAEQDDKAKRAGVFGLEFEPGERDIEILEAFGDFEIEGKIIKNALITIANRSVLLRFTEIPYWGGRPILWGTYDNLWFTPYGRGACEPVMGIYHLINTFSNQKADVLNLIINGCFSYVDDGIIDPEDLILRPGGFIPTASTGHIQPLHPDTNVTLAFSEINELRTRGQASSAASDYVKGSAPSGGRKTAFEVNAISQGSSVRFSDITKHLGDGAMEYTLNFLLESIKQFQFGMPGSNLNQEALMGEYKIKFTGAQLSAVKAYEAQQFRAFMDVVSRSEPMMATLNPIELMHEWRKILSIESGKFIKDKETFDKEVAEQKDQAATEARGAATGEDGGDALDVQKMEATVNGQGQ